MPIHRLVPGPWVCCLTLLCGWIVYQPSAGAQPQALEVRHYDVRIEPDIQAKTLRGSVSVRVRAAGDAAFQLDAGSLQIDAVHEQGQRLAFNKTGTRLTVVLDGGRPAPADRVVEIDFHGTPATGINFLPQAWQVHTAFATSQWMPCVDAPDRRATLQLSLLLPDDLKTVANGRLLHAQPQPGGKTLWVWSQDVPMPSYLFGFAAGRFREAVDDSAAPVLRYLGPDSFSELQLRQIFQDTRRMIAFYADKAGMPYPAASYTQVLVSGPAAQEMAGFAVMGQTYGRRVLDDAAQTWLGAHELSHQWWGNGVTNRDWTEFWLNEGVASFMNAAYFEHRDQSLDYIESAQASYDKIRAAGGDKSLVFPNWDHPSPQDRSLVYDKGALVMQQLRLLMGEAAFWRGLRQYTQQFWGRSVTTRDFQSTMQAATSLDLSAFFDRWVYLSKP